MATGSVIEEYLHHTNADLSEEPTQLNNRNTNLASPQIFQG